RVDKAGSIGGETSATAKALAATDEQRARAIAEMLHSTSQDPEFLERRRKVVALVELARQRHAILTSTDQSPEALARGREVVALLEHNQRRMIARQKRYAGGRR